MAGHFYLLASRSHGTLYAGCTTDLTKRIYEHREGLVPGFTLKYRVKRLVYLETYDDISDAITRERRVKEWKRAWKIQLIERENPFWEDLAVPLLGFDHLEQETPRRTRGPMNRSIDMGGDGAADLMKQVGVHGSRLSPG